MKIGYFADGPWAHEALEKIIRTPELAVVFIVARFDHADPVLRGYAERLRVPFLLTPNVNAPDFIATIRTFQPDLLVSMSFNQILREAILSAAPLGFINCHAGALPFYRGRNILNWALINGEERFGVTVHHVDAGIDTGDIIVQRFAGIEAEDDYGTLLGKAIALCAESLWDALLLIRNGSAPRIPQHTIHPTGFYCSRRGPGDEWLDWNWTSVRVHNFVRAITLPGPGARTEWGENELAVLKTELIKDAPGYLDKPGTVVGRDRHSVTVKTGDATLRVLSVAKVSPEGKLGERELPGFPIGTTLGRDLRARIVRLEQQLRALEAKTSGAIASGHHG